MATEAIEQVPEAVDDTPPSKGKRGVLILGVIGVAAGAATGLLGVGPLLAKKRATPAAVVPTPDSATAPVSSSVTHAIENLVLNPAGSGGTRFLMVTATFELKDASIDQMMKDHEAEVRDHILALLGKKTVDQLTNIMEREAIKSEVLDAVRPLFPKGAVLKVFFPQFVTQ